MRINAFFLTLLTVLLLGALPSQAQDGADASFREPLYFSEFDRDNRSPQAVRVGGVVFVSALSGPGATVEEQARVAYMRLQSVLGNYGMTMAEVAQERVYVKEGLSTTKLDKLRPLFYGEDLGPASTRLIVSGFDDPNTLVAIELIAVADPEKQ